MAKKTRYVAATVPALRTLVVFWLLAAIDGHAKNFSLFLLRGGGYRLTPRCDVLSAYPVLGHGRGRLAPQKVKMAMAVEGKNRHYLWDGIHARHWFETSRRCGVADMPALLADLVVRNLDLTARYTAEGRGVYRVTFASAAKVPTCATEAGGQRQTSHVLRERPSGCGLRSIWS